MKKAIKIGCGIIVLLSLTACGSNGFDLLQTLQSDAVKSCTQCASDLSAADKQKADNASVEAMFKSAGVELPVQE